jgi:hypothetical protein
MLSIGLALSYSGIPPDLNPRALVRIQKYSLERDSKLRPNIAFGIAFYLWNAECLPEPAPTNRIPIFCF